jgi:hypothetical protein
MSPQNETADAAHRRPQNLNNHATTPLTKSSLVVNGLVYPLPPKSMLTRSFTVAMSHADAEYWAASYNRWVDVWNRFERAEDAKWRRGEPSSLDMPEWPDAAEIAGGIGGVPRSVVMFHPRRWDWPHTGMIRVAGFRTYHAGSSFCRNHLDLTKIVWAGWEGGEA